MKNLKKLALLVALTGITTGMTTGMTITQASAFTFGNIGAIKPFKPGLMVERVINTLTEPEGVINGTTTMIKVGDAQDIININKETPDVNFTIHYKYNKDTNRIGFTVITDNNVEGDCSLLEFKIKGSSVFEFKMDNIFDTININFKKVK